MRLILALFVTLTTASFAAADTPLSAMGSCSCGTYFDPLCVETDYGEIECDFSTFDAAEVYINTSREFSGWVDGQPTYDEHVFVYGTLTSPSYPSGLELGCSLWGTYSAMIVMETTSGDDTIYFDGTELSLGDHCGYPSTTMLAEQWVAMKLTTGMGDDHVYGEGTTSWYTDDI